MIKFAVGRLLTAVPLLFIVPLFIFALIELAPGDPAVILAGDDPTPERISTIRDQLGLDRPLLIRYVAWLGSALTGDLGESLLSNRSVTDLLINGMGTTMSLVFVAMVMAVVIGSVLAILSALRPDGFFDRAVNGLSSAAIAVPNFWFALILVTFFAVQNPIFPVYGYVPLSEGFGSWFFHLTLPGIALGLLPAAEVALQLRSSLSQTMAQDFITNARAKGLSEGSIVLKHALKNASVPVATVLGFRLAEVLAGTVTIEIIFSMSGMGRLAVDSVQSRDVPVLLGFVLFSTSVVILVNLIVDISYGYFNPKVRK